MKKGLIIMIALIVLLGCTGGRTDIQPADLEKLEIGEAAYICGCPMMCCNSISRVPGGRCACTVPLRKGTVSAIREGMVYVTIDDGRQKRFFIKRR